MAQTHVQILARADISSPKQRRGLLLAQRRRPHSRHRAGAASLPLIPLASCRMSTLREVPTGPRTRTPARASVFLTPLVHSPHLTAPADSHSIKKNTFLWIIGTHCPRRLHIDAGLLLCTT